MWQDSTNDMSRNDLCSLNERWREVLDIAVKQTVTSLTFKGLESLPDECVIPDDVLVEWLRRSEASRRDSQKMNDELTHLFKHFNQIGEDVILLKGQGLAALYPDPLSRACGDIDLYYTGSEDIFAGLDIKGGARLSDGSYEYEDNGIIIELHDRLSDISRPSKRKIFDQLVAKYGFSGHTPSPYINLLIIITHLLKHSLGAGVGLRQFCDLAVAYKAYADEIDGQEFKKICEDLGLYRWIVALNGFLVRYLSLDRQMLPFDEICSDKEAEYILNRVIASGNFGFYREDGKKRGGIINMIRLFGANIGFAIKYSFGEYIWTIINLTFGRLFR